MTRDGRLRALAVLLAGVGLTLLAGQCYMKAKAALAAVLIDRAFTDQLRDGRPHRPWPWADTHPVASLEVPRIGVRRVVLAGATGNVLAFGLGHVSGTALPGWEGNAVIAGHRDTWGAFLEQLRRSDEIRVRTVRGEWRYEVTRIEVVRKDRVDLLEETDDTRLTLVTCYPFSGLLASPWRYIVVARASSRPCGSKRSAGLACLF